MSQWTCVRTNGTIPVCYQMVVPHTQVVPLAWYTCTCVALSHYLKNGKRLEKQALKRCNEWALSANIN